MLLFHLSLCKSVPFMSYHELQLLFFPHNFPLNFQWTGCSGVVSTTCFLFPHNAISRPSEKKVTGERGWKCSAGEGSQVQTLSRGTFFREAWHYFHSCPLLNISTLSDLLFDSQNISFPMANISWMLMLRHFLLSSAISIFLWKLCLSHL